MENFNETIIKLFRESVQFEELKNCKVYQEIEEWYQLEYMGENDTLNFRVSHKYQVLNPVTKACEELMAEFNDKLFRDKAKIEVLEKCTIQRCQNRSYYLVIQSDSDDEEVLKTLYKNYSLLANTARKCGFFGYLILKKANGNYFSAPCEIERLEDY